MTKSKTSPAYRRRRRRRDAQTRLPWVIGGAVLLVVVLVGLQALLSPRSPDKGPREAEWLQGITGYSYDAGDTEFTYPNPAGFEPGRKWLPSLGEETAPVVIVEFSDIFCSHCRDFNLNTLPEILEDYVATGKVRYVDHFFGFAGSLERGVVQSMMCAAEQGRYFEYKHALFQSLEIGAYDTDRAARVAGIDAAQFETCLEEQQYAGAMQEMIFDDNSGVAATPTFFVNGKMVSGNDLEGIRRLVDAALAEGE